MKLNPGLNSHGWQNDIVAAAKRVADMVAGVLEEAEDCNPFAGTGMVVGVVGKNKDFEITAGHAIVLALEGLKPFIEKLKHSKNITGHVLGIIVGAKQGIVGFDALGVMHKIMGQQAEFVFELMQSKKIAQSAAPGAFYLRVHLALVLHGGADSALRDGSIGGDIKKGTLITRKRFV